MKILCNKANSAPGFYREGWKNAATYLGHDFRFIDLKREYALDVFNRFEPDLYIGETWAINSAIHKAIALRPNLKVILQASTWGEINKEFKTTPVQIPTQEELNNVAGLIKHTGRPHYVFAYYHDRWIPITMGYWAEWGLKVVSLPLAADTLVYSEGEVKKEYICDLAFVGGYWEYKARNLKDYLIRFCHENYKLNIKIYGNSLWPVSQYLGGIDSNNVKDLFKSAGICPCIYEPLSKEFGFDVSERIFKVISSGGFALSENIESARTDFFGDSVVYFDDVKDLEDKIFHYLKNPEERIPYIQKAQSIVLKEHTYINRIEKMLKELT